jgi:hypothetical protein
MEKRPVVCLIKNFLRKTLLFCYGYKMLLLTMFAVKSSATEPAAGRQIRSNNVSSTLQVCIVYESLQLVYGENGNR